ncbi:MAG: hypothetical protein ACI4O7_01390 [Aristaeellaceae bacterium]
MRQLLLLALMVMLLTVPAALADDPTSLPQCTTEEQVLDWLLLPIEDEGVILPVEAQAGYIRYIAQNQSKDPLFCVDYWCSVEPGDNLDLTARKSAKGNTFQDYAGTMCTRASYAMALSYLGVGATPGDMSVLLQARNLDDPYDKVTAALGGLERVIVRSYTFETMLANYESDASYSPVYVYLQKPSGVYHAILIVGRADTKGYYLVVDPATHTKDDEIVRVYRLRFDSYYQRVINSTFRAEHRNSRVVSFCQWHRTGEVSGY